MATSSLATTDAAGAPAGRDERERREKELRSLRRLSHQLDAAFEVPGTDMRVGWDGIIGLIPGVGDVAGAVLSAYLVVRAMRMGAPKPLLARMAGNIAIDALVGTIPIAGDAFDFVYKVNEKNLALLERWLEKEARRLHVV